MFDQIYEGIKTSPNDVNEVHLLDVEVTDGVKAASTYGSEKVAVFIDTIQWSGEKTVS